MSEARSNILARLRGAPVSAPAPLRDTSVLRNKQWTQEEKISRFTAALTAVHAEVHRTTSESWIPLLSELLARRSIRTLMYASETQIGQALDAAGHPLPKIVRYAESIEAFKQELFHEVDAAVTTARAGIAETGSLVLWPTVAEPRLMSLVPPVHIAVLESDRLYNTFYEVLTSEGWANGMPTNALLISGPSKTADIEQTLAYGVHGPGELIVLLVERNA